MVNAIANHEEASYVVWVDGGVYYAQNGATGAVTSNATFSTLVNACITAAAGASDGIIFIKAGSYTLTAQLAMATGVTLCGEGKATIINSGAANIFKIYGTGITDFEIRDLKLLGGGNAAGDCGIVLEGASSFGKIENVFVQNVYNQGIGLQGGCHDIDIISCDVDDTVYGQAYMIYGVAATPAYNVRLIDCQARDCEGALGYGFEFSGVDGGGLTVPYVYDCAAYGFKSFNCYYGLRLTNAARCIIDGFETRGNAHGGVEIYNTVDCTVSNGITSDNHEYGVAAWNDNGRVNTRDLTIQNVKSLSNDWGGIVVSLGGQAGALRASVLNCTLYDNAADAGTDNLQDSSIVLADVTHGKVSGCTIQVTSAVGGIAGIYLNAGADYASVTDNTIVGTGEADGIGVYVNGPTYCTIEGNPIDHIKQGVYEDSTANYNLIQNNNFTQVGAGLGCVIAGANTQVRNNRGFVTENSGTGTLLNTATSIIIHHGCNYTPSVGYISIVWAENPTNLIADWWIDNIDADHFTLNGVDPGASNLDFGWAVRRI